MTDLSNKDYSLLDNPMVLNFLFHPRPGYGVLNASHSSHDILIPVEDPVVIGARFHINDKSDPNILFFHGNGEIVDDYDDLGPIYNQMGINLLAVDYRGYGQSTGSPSSSAMVEDSHKIYDFVATWLIENEHTGPLILMGRSLGSASVLELAAHYQDRIAGLILESAFAYTMPLFRLIGIDPDALGYKESDGFENLEKIKTFYKPTLVIHAEYDHIIPFSDGQALYDASPAADKRLLKIPHANHNDILSVGFSDYMKAVRFFCYMFD
jgi:hypothetical protein